MTDVNPQARVPAHRRRWLSLTPVHAMLGMLAVEGLLMLSERFRWFPFNQHKGWTVLVTVAAVLVWFILNLLLRRRFQFSLRALLVLVVVIAVPCSWMAAAQQWYKLQREAFVRRAGIPKTHFSVDFDIDPFSGETEELPAWLVNVLGVGFFERATLVFIGNSLTTYEDLARCVGLPEVDSITLFDTQVTDAGIEHLSTL